MNKLTDIRIFILLSLTLSAAVQAAGEKPSEVRAATTAKQTIPAVEVPELSADAKKLLDQVGKRISNINTKEFIAMTKPQSSTVVIDVRDPDEITLRGGYIRAENYFNIPRGQLEFRIATLVPGKDTPIIVYDDFSQRSPLAAEALARLGYSKVKNYADGFYK